MLLERDHVLGELDALAAAAAEGRGRIAFVIGEAGIGKTSVLRAARERWADRLRAFWTACEDISSAEALTILRELPESCVGNIGSVSKGGERIDLFREVLDNLAQVPSVLFVEDLHWADDGSIDFLRYAGRRIEDLPLLIVISSRNEEQTARSRIVRTSGDLSPSARCRFDLVGLSSEAVGRLAAAQGQLGSKVHEVTNGNPLLVTELLANSGARTHTIDEIITGRASLLPTGARSFLEYCSVIPRRVSIEQIEASGADDEDIQTCIDCGLLLPDGDGLAFRHELTRHAISDALPPLRRRQMHARELERLERVGGSMVRQLHHAFWSKNRERVRELAPAVAERAAAFGAHGGAVQAWSAMLDTGEPVDDPVPCERYAFELHMVGRLPDAIEWQQRALALHIGSGNRLKQGDNLRFLSRLRYMSGERTLAEKAAQQAVEILEPLGESAELALAYATLAQLAMLNDQDVEAIRLSKLALPMGEKFGRDDVVATTLINYGTSLQYRDFARGCDMLDQSIRLAKETGSHEHVARAYINKGWMHLMRPALPEALAILREGIDFCRDHDIANMQLYMRGGVAMCMFGLGLWDEASEEAGMVLAHPANTDLTGNPATRVLAALNVRRGTNRSAEFFGILRRHDERGREAPRFNSYAKLVAESAWTERRETAEANDLLERAISQLGKESSPLDASELWFWHRKLGSKSEVIPGMLKPYADLAAGNVADAAEGLARMNLPFEQALVLVEGDEEQAAQGLFILEQLGAEATAARVRADLAERGIRKGTRGPRASTRSNQHGLTRRELDVLREIEGGLSNKEIANKLFVSPKTVDHHVSSILAKTDTKSRGEAAALARREQLID